MSYRATLNGNVFFNTNSIDQALGLLSASLTLKVGSAGLFSFTVTQKNKYYGEFHLISDYIDFYRDDELLFSGRVSSIEMEFDLTMKIEAEGLLSILNDTVFRPITHEGTLYQLVSTIIASHNSQVENAKRLNVGVITVADRACYRAYENYESSFSRISDLVDSYGGHPSIRKTSGALYFDWYQSITTQSMQSVDFGENELDVTQNSTTENYISVLIPLGAQIEDEITGARSRVTIESVNGGKDYIEDSGAINKIVGTYIWDDITSPSNLLAAGETYLENQAILRTSIKVTAVDLADAGYNIDHFKLGTIIPVTSRPHGLNGQTFECLEQGIDPLNPDGNTLILGGVIDGFTIKAQKEAKLNTKVIERIEANYATNKRFNDLKTTLEQDIQENYTLIEQNSEQIRLLASEVVSVSRIFYETPVPPYKKGDLWYRGADDDDNTAGVPGYAIPGLSSPGIGGDLFVTTRDRDEEDTFDADDWVPVYKGQFEYINKRVSRAEISIDGAKADINLQASQVESLTGRMTQAEIDIDGANAAIALKVDNSDYNGASIVAKINGAGSSVSINADKINLNGVVTANNYFKINADGSMETIAGHIGGFEIDATSLHSSGKEVSDNSTGSVALSSSPYGFERTLTTHGGPSGENVLIGNLMLAIGSGFGVTNAGHTYCNALVGSSMEAYNGKFDNGYIGSWFYDPTGELTITDSEDSSFASTIKNGYLFFTKDFLLDDVSTTSSLKMDSSTRNITGNYWNLNLNNGTGSFGTSVIVGSSNVRLLASGDVYCSVLHQTSDRSMKTNVFELSEKDSSEFIYALKTYSFDYIDNPGRTRHGFMADQISQINNRKWDVVEESTLEDKSFKTVVYTDIIADIVATVQSHNKRIKALEEKGV